MVYIDCLKEVSSRWFSALVEQNNVCRYTVPSDRCGNTSWPIVPWTAVDSQFMGVILNMLY